MRGILGLALGVAAALLLGILSAAPASAQQAVIYPFDTPHGLPAQGARDGMGTSPEYWQTCERRDHDQPELTIQSCGRVIGARYSREHSAAAHYYRAVLLEDTGQSEGAQLDYGEALRLFSDIIQSEPRDPYAHFNRTAVLFRVQRFEEALADNERGLSVGRSRRTGRNSMWGTDHGSRSNPSDDVLAYGRAQRCAIYFWMGRYSEAIEACATASELAPEDADYHASRCEAEAALGANLNRAASACESALVLAGHRDANPLVARGFLHFVRGEFDAASRDFVSAVQVNNTHAAAYYGRGVTAIKAGRQAEGDADIARAMQLDPRLVARYANAGVRP